MNWGVWALFFIGWAVTAGLIGYELGHRNGLQEAPSHWQYLNDRAAARERLQQCPETNVSEPPDPYEYCMNFFDDYQGGRNMDVEERW